LQLAAIAILVDPADMRRDYECHSVCKMDPLSRGIGVYQGTAATQRYAIDQDERMIIHAEQLPCGLWLSRGTL
jgi:hypothetical protein